MSTDDAGFSRQQIAISIHLYESFFWGFRQNKLKLRFRIDERAVQLPLTYNL